MVNEEIIGGLMSALSRGEPLQTAMMTFYNAGYGKEEIEEAAKVVYIQGGAQIAKTGFLKETVHAIASKVGLVKKNIITKVPPQNINSVQNTTKEIKMVNKNIERFPQKVSNYGGKFQNLEQVTSKIERAIKDLNQLKFPSKIEVVNKTGDAKQPFVVQRVSNYSGDLPPKSVSKVITYILVFILILLLGALAAVFFFKEDLIKIFNDMGLS